MFSLRFKINIGPTSSAQDVFTLPQTPPTPLRHPIDPSQYGFSSHRESSECGIKLLNTTEGRRAQTQQTRDALYRIRIDNNPAGEMLLSNKYLPLFHNKTKSNYNEYNGFETGNSKSTDNNIHFL